MHKELTVQFESFLLPPGFSTDGYEIFKGSSYLKRKIRPFPDKTISYVEYYMPDEDLRDEIIEEDYEELCSLGPQEMIDGCWLIKGSLPVILTAPHSVGPRADKGVSQLVYAAQKITGANALLSTVSRKISDYNSNGLLNTPFYRKINELLPEACLLIDVHSGGGPDYDVELGSGSYNTASSVLVQDIKDIFEGNDYVVVVDKLWTGGSIIWNCKGIDSVQIEISRSKVNDAGILNSLAEVIRGTSLCKHARSKQ